jgi:hypothetical protein
MVAYLPHNLKIEGSCPACAQIFFRYTAGKFQWRRKVNRKFRPTCNNYFLLCVRNESAAPGLGAEINVTACNSVTPQLTIATPRLTEDGSCLLNIP